MPPADPPIARGKVPSWNDARRLASSGNLPAELAAAVEKLGAEASELERLRHRLRVWDAVSRLQQKTYRATTQSAVARPTSLTTKHDLRDVLELLNAGTLQLGQYFPVKGYATANPGLRRRIHSLRDRVSRQFGSDEKQEPLTVLLTASPGLGKSYLASCLISAFCEDSPDDVLSLSLNLARLGAKSELREFLRSIDRKRTSGRRVIAFVDEVDALVAGAHAYSELLDTMEAKAPTPAAIFFAASAASDERSFRAYLEELPASAKGLDFLSRMKILFNMLSDLFRDPLEKIVRAAAITVTKMPRIDGMDGPSVFFLGARDTTSTRELEHVIDGALAATVRGAKILRLIGTGITLHEFNTIRDAYPEVSHDDLNVIISLVT